MPAVFRYRSQRLFRKSPNSNRVLRIKPVTKLHFVFRPVRFGLKPQIKKTDPRL
jgi:hypothetical protein